MTSIALAQTNTLRVEVSGTRSRSSALERADAAVRQFNRNLAILTARSRETQKRSRTWKSGAPFTMPARVELLRNGQPFPPAPKTRDVNGDITLSFDTTGPRAFPAEYRQFLQDVFERARPTLNAVFGTPIRGGTVKVSNYDADIGDREAVAGGYYVPDVDERIDVVVPEIRFPVYQSAEGAAVNFLHAVLLAYQGDRPYVHDAFQEGLVRAATAVVARTPAATVGLAPDIVEGTLQNTYEVGGLYDWYNQRALSGSKFIAPNLRDQPLPVGGSFGGLYLLRYRMAGAAWLKVLVEYPSFISRLNAALKGNANLATDTNALVAQGQAILNTLRPTDPTIEGLTFAEWFRRQFILETRDTTGLKLLLQPTPITSGLSGSDYGVFALEATYFERKLDGRENLLSGTAYPIFWDVDFLNRLSPSAQDERMDILLGYGSVAPNFSNERNGQPYRVNVDLPVQDQIARVYLPAGAIATPANQATPNDLYGTVEGVALTPGTTLRVQVSLARTVIADVPVSNGAFGTRVGTDSFLGARSLDVRVVRANGAGQTVVLSRRVNKSVGALALDLRVGGEGSFTFPNGLPKGLSLIGFPIDPFASYQPDVLGVNPSQLLVARYNASRAQYDLFPEVEPFKQGLGYFVRMPEARNVTVEGRLAVEPTAVALRPGWNLVTTPVNQSVGAGQIQVVRATGFPQSYVEAVGTDIGVDFFAFNRGPNDPATGASETGNFTAATTFEPGKAYYVRCLAPEGVTMLFNAVTRSRTRTVSAQSVRSGTAKSGTATRGLQYAPFWRMRIDTIGGGTKTECIVGMTYTSTRSFDSREDSLLPPSLGGLQASVIDGQPLYRDMRPRASRESYTLRLDGLKRGTEYTIAFNQQIGFFAQMSLHDPVKRVRVPVKQGTRYTFVASGADQTFTLTVGANR
jgi:hypothetical protein